MPGYVGWQTRDRLAPTFRRQLWKRAKEFPFPAQAALWLAMEGWELTEQTLYEWPFDPDHDIRDEQPDFDTPWFDVLTARYLACDVLDPDNQKVITSDEFWSLNPNYPKVPPLWAIDDSQPQPSVVERRAMLPRRGGRARQGSVLTGYKFGKSKIGGRHYASTLLVPGVEGDLVGAEYDTCTPEFSYILDCLFSEAGYNIPVKKPNWPGLYCVSLQNRPRAGLMTCTLSNGSKIEARSYERFQGLKGKERDFYLFCEHFMLPGLVAYTDIAQNLDARNGEAMFATTPDAAHIDILRELGEDPEEPDWFVVPNVPRSANPYAFNFRRMEQQRKIMTIEKFKIGWMGVLGEYVGSVYDYRRGERVFDTKTHPHLWKDPNKPPTRDNCKIPDHWAKVGGADTGTMYSGVIAAFSDDDPPHLFFLDERPNYRYVATEIEQDKSYSVNDWYQDIKAMSWYWGGDGTFRADPNSQFKQDAFSAGGITIEKGEGHPEARTEVLRSYFQGGRAWVAPWLQVLPYELEIARYPPKETSTGAWRRVSEKDHTLDPAEHIACARAEAEPLAVREKRLAIETLWNVRARPPSEDPHGLG